MEPRAYLSIMRTTSEIGMTGTAGALLCLALLDITPVPGCFKQFYDRPGSRTATDKRLLGEWTCSLYHASGDEDLSDSQPVMLTVAAAEVGFVADAKGLFEEGKTVRFPGECATVAGQSFVLLEWSGSSKQEKASYWVARTAVSGQGNEQQVDVRFVRPEPFDGVPFVLPATRLERQVDDPKLYGLALACKRPTGK